ncbi:TauD/TfdA family dioxygenase [Dankookia rubra]|uniref:TauD/TfdA family dioxygenase n=1 Tax=Dankookia rubra TaxID=1442381 RepID=A0A4V3A9C5_9PROT|nr:TauD/TfdA family dioxygenase [Dankookia rubra]TDH58725.1 TauD/TfdA family dioxygenase [Dankookia rubra]
MPLTTGPIGGSAAWVGEDMATQLDWIVAFTPAELTEIDAAIEAHHRAGRAMGEITPETFRLPTLARRLSKVLDDLLEGRGFVLMRGFDVSARSVEDAAIAYLGIGSHLGGFRSQNARGHLLGHVNDLGFDIRNPKVRYYQTNKELEFHTDSCDVVGLLCLKTARAGGGSRIVSSVALHDRMLAETPDLCRALYNPMPTDRRGEVPPGMLPWFEIPVFNWHAGRLSTIYSGQYIRSAQVNFPEARRLSAIEHAALDRLDALASELSLQMDFQPGDMQFIHNHQILHSRTDFEDWPEPEKRRHLLRLWLSPKQARDLPPVFAQRYGDITPGNRGGIVVQDTVLRFTLEPA